MIQTAFVHICWGLLMVLVDVRIGRLDLVPDFIGYLFVINGLRQLAALHGSFGTASSHALVLLVFSVLEVIGVEHMLLSVIDIVFDLLMFWAICDGIIALANASENGGLAGAARSRRTALAVMSAINLTVLVVWRDPELIRKLLIPLVICTITVTLLLIHLMWRASVELAAVDPGPAASG